MDVFFFFLKISADTVEVTKKKIERKKCEVCKWNELGTVWKIKGGKRGKQINLCWNKHEAKKKQKKNRIKLSWFERDVNVKKKVGEENGSEVTIIRKQPIKKNDLKTTQRECLIYKQTNKKRESHKGANEKRTVLRKREEMQ